MIYIPPSPQYGPGRTQTPSLPACLSNPGLSAFHLTLLHTHNAIPGCGWLGAAMPIPWILHDFPALGPLRSLGWLFWEYEDFRSIIYVCKHCSFLSKKWKPD